MHILNFSYATIVKISQLLLNDLGKAKQIFMHIYLAHMMSLNKLKMHEICMRDTITDTLCTFKQLLSKDRLTQFY